MSGTETDARDIEQAKRNASRAKARMQSTVGALKQRLSPRNIVADAKGKVREKTGAVTQRASGAVRKRPAATTTAAGVAALVLFRKPVGKLIKRLFRRKPRQEEVADPRKDDGIIRAGEPPKASITPKMQRAVAKSNAAALEQAGVE